MLSLTAGKDSYISRSIVPGKYFLQFSININYFFDRKIICPTFALAKNGTDSVAQLVEHIPFKDGVLGSNPSWITRQTMLREEHFLFDERNKTLVLIPRGKQQMTSPGSAGTHCLFCRSPLEWIMPPPGDIIPIMPGDSLTAAWYDRRKALGKLSPHLFNL
jgi:hypothetical protein